MGKRIRKEIEIDSQTNEVLSEKNTFVEYKSKEKYVMKYRDKLGMYKNLKAVSKNVLLFEYLIEIVEFDTGKIYLTPKIRLDIMDVLDISKSSLSLALKQLIDAEFIYGSRNDYIINPHLTWFGYDEGRGKAIKYVKENFSPKDDWVTQAEDFMKSGNKLDRLND